MKPDCSCTYTFQINCVKVRNWRIEATTEDSSDLSCCLEPPHLSTTVLWLSNKVHICSCICSITFSVLQSVLSAPSPLPVQRTNGCTVTASTTRQQKGFAGRNSAGFNRMPQEIRESGVGLLMWRRVGCCKTLKQKDVLSRLQSFVSFPSVFFLNGHISSHLPCCDSFHCNHHVAPRLFLTPSRSWFSLGLFLSFGAMREPSSLPDGVAAVCKYQAAISPPLSPVFLETTGAAYTPRCCRQNTTWQLITINHTHLFGLLRASFSTTCNFIIPAFSCVSVFMQREFKGTRVLCM